MTGSFSLVIHADINAIPQVSSALEGIMKDHAFLEEEILDTQLAVEEAITNVIVHGYDGKEGTVAISCRASKGLVEIQIEDTAVPFNPLALPEPDLTGSIDERKIGGLGIFLIRQVMDDIQYRYEDNKNVLVLVKRRSAAA